mgnify:FL=1
MSLRARIAAALAPELLERKAPTPSFSISGPTIAMDSGLGTVQLYGMTPSERQIEQAFSVSAFHACVRVIAESVAQLPMRLMMDRDGTAVKAENDPLYSVLHRQVNGYQSSWDWRCQMATNCCVWGNAYSVKEYNNRGEVIALWPIHPACVSVELLKNNTLVYDYMAGPGAEPVRFRQDDIVHIRYLSDNGYLGMVPVTLMNGVIQAARNIDLYTNNFYQNDCRPSCVITTANPVPQEAADRMRRSWEAMFRGPANSGKTAVLPHGVAVAPVESATNESAQMVQYRNLLTQQIARAMRVPNHLIGEDSRSTFSNAEQASLNWLSGGLSAWISRFESALNQSLLQGREDHFVQIDVRGMLRGDAQTRAGYYQQLFQIGVLSPAEIRSLEDMPPVEQPGMEDHYVPVNNYATTAEAAKEKEGISNEQPRTPQPE